TKWDLIRDPEAPSFERFSILVSNPPYIPLAEAAEVMPEVAHYEPHAALFVDGDPLLFYRAILVAADDLLLPGGYLFFEVNPDFAVDIEHIMQSDHGFVATGIELDLAGRNRIVWGCCDG
ncbi:MAG: peptide chain release factor N(5)-glutamine methyltransferase, partial [Rhodothermales bacterium]